MCMTPPAAATNVTSILHSSSFAIVAKYLVTLTLSTVYFRLMTGNKDTCSVFHVEFF